jgi:hypothetical protein
VQSGLSNNLYVQIGLVLLMALSAKNAILIVEQARALRAQGAPIARARWRQRARFRPILMTSFAFILGVLPLVLASGAGASARNSIMLVQASERRNSFGNPSRVTVRISSMPSRGFDRGNENCAGCRAGHWSRSWHETYAKISRLTAAAWNALHPAQTGISPSGGSVA